jgi:hypothetical protein
MLIRFRYLVVAAAIAAIVSAPAAVADPEQSCHDITGAATECSSPGNVQITDAPPEVGGGGFESGFYGGPYPVPFNEGD